MDGTGVTQWDAEQTERICAYRFQTPEMPTDGLITGKYAKQTAPAVPAGIEGFTSGGELLGLGLALAALVLFLA